MPLISSDAFLHEATLRELQILLSTGERCVLESFGRAMNLTGAISCTADGIVLSVDSGLSMRGGGGLERFQKGGGYQIIYNPLFKCSRSFAKTFPSFPNNTNSRLQIDFLGYFNQMLAAPLPNNFANL